MSQPTAVIVGGADDQITQQLRLHLSSHSWANRYEFASVRLALERLPPDQAATAFFFCAVRAADDIGALATLSNCFAGRPLAAIFAYAHADRAVVDAMRAGAAQVVPYPLDGADLAAAIERLLIQFGQQKLEVRTIAVCGVHGGVGATTLTLNLASALAALPELALRCMVLENARTAGTIISALGLHPRYTAQDLFDRTAGLDLTMLHQVLTELRPNVTLLPAPREGLPRKATEEEYQALRHLIAQVVDVVIVDFNYFNDKEILQRIAAFDHCLLVAAHAVPSLDSLKAVHDMFRAKLPSARSMLVINAYDPGNAHLSIAMMEHLLGAPVRTIRQDVAGVKRAADAGDFLDRAAPSSVVLEDIRALAHELFNLPTATMPRGTLLGLLRDWFRR